MNSVLRSFLMNKNNVKSLLNPIRTNNVKLNTGSNRQLARNLWYMCNYNKNEGSLIESVKLTSPTQLCSCGCGILGIHTKGERELVEFLTEEILAERKAQKNKNIPTEFEGFKVSLDGSEMTLSKITDKETIKIQFSVNHTVDTEAQPEINQNKDKPDVGELKSKPAFRVDFVRDKTTLTMLCSFIQETDQEEGYNDIFTIDELSIYQGEWNDNVYAVSGEVLDGYLYDLLMNLLEEKGISNEFAEKMVDLSTTYEHALYISLLEGLSKFASGK